jgi:hypothetical protein
MRTLRPSIPLPPSPRRSHVHVLSPPSRFSSPPARDASRFFISSCTQMCKQVVKKSGVHYCAMHLCPDPKGCKRSKSSQHPLCRVHNLHEGRKDPNSMNKTELLAEVFRLRDLSIKLMDEADPLKSEEWVRCFKDEDYYPGWNVVNQIMPGASHQLMHQWIERCLPPPGRLSFLLPHILSFLLPVCSVFRPTVLVQPDHASLLFLTLRTAVLCVCVVRRQN